VSGASDLADRLGRALGGTVTSLRALPGGASRLTSALDVEDPGGGRRSLVLQQQRGTGLTQSSTVVLEAALLRAALRAGVPVPRVLAAGAADGLDPGWLIVERLEGETLARRLLRDEAYAEARGKLCADVARALAQIHTIPPHDVPGLPSVDPFERPLEFLDGIGEVRPVLEFGSRWLAANRPPAAGRTLVHGDFRMGNFLVDATGLRGVLDWELAHAGDPAEDLGWLSARAWRFGARDEVGGFSGLDDFLAQYAASSGRLIAPTTVRWWQAYASLKWAVICALQACTHLGGTARSVELAAIGRRVCESEWDLLGLIGVERPEMPDGPQGTSTVPAPFGRPSARELIEAVGEYLEVKVMGNTEGAPRFEARVARNVLEIVARELAVGADIEAAHHLRLEELGFADDAVLAAAIRAGDLDGHLPEVGAALARSAVDQLRVANPGYVTTTSGDS
jgi:aminoglycoside phosphotransferase (APT) family kinase protein